MVSSGERLPRVSEFLSTALSLVHSGCIARACELRADCRRLAGSKVEAANELEAAVGKPALEKL